MKKKKIILLSEPSRMLMKKSKEKRIYYYNTCIYHHISCISVNEVCGLLMKYSYSSNPIFILKEGIKLILTRIKRKPDLN